MPNFSKTHTYVPILVHGLMGPLLMYSLHKRANCIRYKLYKMFEDMFI